MNFKNNSSYLATLATGFTLPTNVRFQGYAVTPGDGGKFVLDFGGTTSSAYMTVITGELVDAILTGAATSGTGVGAQAGAGSYLLRVVVHGARGSGFVLANDAVAEECEAYGCNLSNDANSAGFFLNGSSRPMASRCYSHDNGSGINARGFAITGNGILLDSIADSNAGSGLEASGISARVFGFAAYNNALDGIRLSNAAYAVVLIENSSLFKNGGYGINGTGAGTRSGQVANCAYGSGTQANTGGNNTGLKSMVEFGAVIYTANGTPWNSPTSGDFRNVGAPVEGAGRGSYTQTGSGKSGTIGYPDIGSAQSKAAAGMILSRVRTGF
ncbi:MAG: right-handed parallel beta-helix repeat-containing protein [Ignavibacteriota bacterium]